MCPSIYENTMTPMGLGKRKLTYPIQRSCVSFASDILLHSLPPHTRTTSRNSWRRVGTMNHISIVSFDSICLLKSNDFVWLTLPCHDLSFLQVRRKQMTRHCRMLKYKKMEQQPGFFSSLNCQNLHGVTG